MKIILTGSLGNISRPLAVELVQKGHAVTVISSKPERQQDIAALGATAAIGTLEDVDFLTAAFTGTDAVYCMVPPNFYFNHDLDPIDYCRLIGTNYAQAIQRSGALAGKIKQYEYFGYSVREALFLLEKEEAAVIDIMQHIRQEYRSNIDRFSEDIMIAQLELLLSYSERFYHRQFITRKIAHHQVLDRLENLLTSYFNSDDLVKKGLPTVQYIAGELNVSPNYLSGLLKALTGQSTQQHIHDKLIEKAKEKLSTTGLSVSEIAYELGFEHPQSFSKLFRTKTRLSRLEFRQSFN